MRECARSHRSLSPIDSFTHRFAPKLQKHPSTHARSFPPSSLFSLLRPSLRRRLAPRCRRRRRAAVGRSVYGRLRARPCARLPLRRRRRRSVRGLSLASVSATLQIALRPSASLRVAARHGAHNNVDGNTVATTASKGGSAGERARGDGEREYRIITLPPRRRRLPSSGGCGSR